jgi:hypothetical protein
MTETNKVETRRIEVIGVELNQNLDLSEVLVDFEFGSVLVNFSFRKSDLPMLKKMIVEVEKEFEDEEASSK